MASANFLEEALKSDVDESAVNAIVGTLENQLDVNTNQPPAAGTFVVNASVHSSITSSTTTSGTVIGSGGGSGGVKTVVGGSANNHNSVGSVSVSLSNSNNNNNSGGAQQQQHQQQQQQQQQQHHQLQRNAHPATVVATGGTTGGGGGGTVNIISQQIVVPARSGSGTTVVGGQQHHQHPPPPPFNVPPQQPTNVSSSGNIVLSSNAHHHHIVTSSNMPKNEPVKLVYPAGGPQAVLNMNNNRVTLTPSSLPNGGTLTMSQQPQLIQTSVGGAKTLTGATIQQHQQQQQQATVVNQAGQQQQQQGQQPGQQTIIIKNASGGNTVMNAGAPGIVTVSKPMNNQATPNIVGLPGGVQIVNVRPGAQPTQAQQKTVAAVSPRVVIGSQPIVSTRPPNASAPGSTLLLKNEQGQFQLLRIGPAPAGTQITPAGLTGSSANQTIRLQTVPATHSSGSGAIIVSSQSITTTPASYISTQPTPVASVAPKSLPLLRQSLVTKEITIEGINPPSTAVAFGTTALSQIPAQIRPVAPTIVSQNSMVGQTQIRMLTSQSGVTTVPRIGQTTIRPAAPVRIQTPLQQQQQPGGGTTTTIVGPRSITAQQIRPNATTIGHTTIVQTAGGQQLPQTISTTPPALLPIRAPSGTSITRTGATLQIRTTTPVSRTVTSVGGTTVTTGGLGKQLLQSQVNQIRGQTPVASVAAVAAAAAAAASGTTATQVKQVTAITGGGNVVVSLNQVPPPMQPVSGNASIIGGTAVSLVPTMPALTLTSSAVSAVGLSAAGIVSSSSASSSSASSSSSAATTVGPPGGISATVVVNSVPSATPAAAVASAAAPPTGTTSIGTAASGVGGASSSSSSSAATVTTVSTNKTVTAKSQNLSGASKKKAGAASAASGPDAESAASKRAGASAQSQFYHHHASMYGDDDINDVAAMGGVNLAEETQRILGSTEFVGTQIRSCKDEVFLHLPALQSRIRAIIARHGLEEPSNEVAVLISHACQERLKNVVEKLAIIAEHRIDIIKVDPRYEVTKDVRGQIKFLEELDKAEQKRHEEQEREMLMRAAKSRSKTEDPEQAKLKAKAKEMQRAEMEELRQRDANLTALQAIGPRKKPKLEEGASASTTPGVSGISTLSGKAPTPLRPRIKRVNLRDMLFYLEQERETGKSQMLYKAYLK
uniref:Transcription initiation factor TFIID component TAF4 C-terminal domain-containing protein n=1 Tax=Anopheles coluzzii TaxID=1518534 RepID=A0A8W7PG74_ANOCL